MKRILLFALLTGVLAANTGCGLFQTCCCQPCGNRGCGSLYYNTGCGCAEPACAVPRCATCAQRRAPVCDDCNDGCGRVCGRCNSCGDCDSCGSSCGNNRPWHNGPLSCAFAYLGRIFFCCPSCGERYWGDYYGDPPDCCDPCDNCGNYTGGGCPTCGSRGRVQRYGNGDYVEEGAEEMATPQGAVITQPERTASPTPAATSTLKPAVAPRRTVQPSTSGNNNSY